MGSTPSRTRVKSIQTPAKDRRDLQIAVPQSRLQQAWACEKEDLHERVKVLEGLLAECQMRTKEEEERAKAAESQIEVLQQQLIELRDHLSKQTSERQHSATVKAQEQFIKKLEEELADAKWETRQTKERYEHELQKVRSSSARSQAKSALTVFELKDENTKLLEENTKLLKTVSQVQAEKEALSRHTSASSQKERVCVSAEREEIGSAEGHVRLILELSRQVSALDTELKQAHETIQRLREESTNEGNYTRSSSSSASCDGGVSVGDSKCSLLEELPRRGSSNKESACLHLTNEDLPVT